MTWRLATLVLLSLVAASASLAQEPTPAPAPAPPGEEPARPVPGATTQEPAEAPTAPPAASLPEVTVTATRTRRPVLRTPRAVTVLTESEIEARSPRSLVDALHEEIGLWVEHRTGTTGDPVLRGLAGGNILTLVDGTTLSSFWGEGGFGSDDMYGKVDPDTIGRIEVVRGPSSVLYGSQALGGVINLITREVPLDFPEEGVRAGAASRIRFGSAAREWRWRNEVYAATPGLRAMFGSTTADVNDLEGGRGVGVMDGTGGREWNWDGKVEAQPAKGHLLTVTFRDVNRRDVRRYYRPTQDNDNDLTAIMARWRLEPSGEGATLAGAEAKVFYQKKVDTRTWLAQKDIGRMGRARTESWQGDLQASLGVGPEGNKLTAGLGARLDVGESADDEEFTERRNTWSLGPAGERTAGPDTWWGNLGVFLNDEWDVGAITLVAGVRLDTFRFVSDPYSSQYYPPSYTGVGLLEDSQRPDDDTSSQWSWTGGLGATWEVVPGAAVFVDGSRGFRQWAPRFGIAQVGAGILVPSPMPDPVISWTAEGGVKAEGRKIRGEGVAYYTYFDGFLQDVPGTYQGQDWYDWDGDTIRDPLENVYVRKASGTAWVGGFEVQATYRLEGDVSALGLGPKGWWDGLSIRGGFAWNYGRDQEAHGPFRFTQPARGVVAVRWDEPEARRVHGEVVVDMVRHFKRVPADRLANDVAYWRDPADPASGKYRTYGLPGYTVVHVRGGVKLSDHLDVTAGVENVTDRRYRRAHDRMRAESGINAVLAVTLRLG